MKLLFPKQNYNVLYPSSYTHISERGLCISRICPYSAAGKYVDQSWEHINRSQTHECGGTEAAQFPEKEYINGIFLAVQFQKDSRLTPHLAEITTFKRSKKKTSTLLPFCLNDSLFVKPV
jgi:hypothetical protein